MFGMQPTKLYSVYIKPEDDAPHETAEFIEEHFSFWGFIFHGLWCLYHGLWVWAAIIIASWAIFVSQNADLLPFDLGFEFSVFTALGMELILRAIVGFEGNHWRGAALKSKGYILSDVVSGVSELEAKRRFFDHWLAATQRPHAA